MDDKLIRKKTAVILCLSFVFPVIWMAAVFAEKQIYPGGTYSALIYDLRDQYMEFLASLRYIGSDGNSFFFNWNRSMGGNFLGLFAYYIASPLSFLTLFFPIEQMPLAIYLLQLLKIGLCGLSWALFLCFGFTKKRSFFIPVFASCYALMSYTIMYGMSLMWLDGVIFLPLVLLGVEKILQGRKGGIFLASLTALFVSNYYTSYMVGIFSALYLVLRILTLFDMHQFKAKWGEMKKEIGSVLLHFFGNTLLALGLSMPIWLPAMLDIRVGKLSMSSRSQIPAFQFSFFEVFRKLFSVQYDSIDNDGGLPSIFCGTLTVVLFVLFFLQKKHARKEKIGIFCLWLFFLLSFWIGPLDTAWHIFQYPNFFPYRYAFCFSAFMLWVAYQAFLEIQETLQKKKIYGILAVVFTMIELFFNASFVTGGLHYECRYMRSEEYEKFMAQAIPALSYVKERDNGVYRMDKDFAFSKNDAMLLGYKGMTHFSSTFHQGVSNLTGALGMAKAWFKNMGYGSSMLTDSLFSVKYRLFQGRMPISYEPLQTLDKTTVAKNSYFLPVAYLLPAGNHTAPLTLTNDPYSNQNALVSLMLGEEREIFFPLELETNETQEGWQYHFTTVSDDPVYIYIRGNLSYYMNDVDVSERKQSFLYLNGEFFGEYFSEESYCSVYLGEFKPGTALCLDLKTKVETYEAYVYQMNWEAYCSLIEQLQDGGMDVEAAENGKISGTITAEEDGNLFTSLPYDTGFTVKVDGKKVRTECFADTFLLIPVTAGKHRVEISYLSPGFLPGCVIMLIAIALAAGFYRRSSCKKNGKPKDASI